MKFSEKVRALRKEHGLTQEALADAIGRDATTVQYWEYGATRPRAESVRRLAKVFNCDEKELIDGE